MQQMSFPGKQEMWRGPPREGDNGDEVCARGERSSWPETGKGGAGEEAEGGHEGGRPTGAQRKPAGPGKRPTAAAVWS